MIFRYVICREGHYFLWSVWSPIDITTTFTQLNIKSAVLTADAVMTIIRHIYSFICNRNANEANIVRSQSHRKTKPLKNNVIFDLFESITSYIYVNSVRPTLSNDVYSATFYQNKTKVSIFIARQHTAADARY